MALRALPEALRIPVGGEHSLLVTEAGHDGRVGLSAVIFLGKGETTLGFARVNLAVPEHRLAVAQGWASLDGIPAEAFEAAFLRAAPQVEIVLREQARASAQKGPAAAKGEAQGRALELVDPEPWPEPVDGAALLEDVAALFSRYVVLPDGAADVQALWVAHTYGVELFEHTGYLALVSPVMRCGKTTNLRIVQALARRSLSVDDASPAALFRVIEKASPTLSVDEVDRIPQESDVWGILNSGHTRGGAVLRTVGDDHEPRAFATYCPKVLAYIRGARCNVPSTLEDRSIRITLQRRPRGVRRDKLRTRDLEAAARSLRSQLLRWLEDIGETLASATPRVPDELDDRAADAWEPMLALADLAGGTWPKKARALAVAFSSDRAEEEADAPGVRVVLDLGELLESGELKANDLGISGDFAVRLLRDLPERPWKTWGRRGDGLTETALARLLRPFGVRSEMVGPRERRRKRYSETALRSVVESFTGGVRVGSTLTPSHTPETVAASDSAARGVRVCDLEPHAGGERAHSTLTSEVEL